MPKLKVNRYVQDPSCCAIASCSSLANFFDKNMNYENVKKITLKNVSKRVPNEGMESSEMLFLLNLLGFEKTTLISTNLICFDYDWTKCSKKQLLNNIRKMRDLAKNKDEKKVFDRIEKWYGNEGFDNNIIIGFDYGQYIRDIIDRGLPVVISFNWTVYMKFPKYNNSSDPDPYSGSEEIHAVVVDGYDENNFSIVDSHVDYYKYSRKKYKEGRYNISRENLMTCMGTENDIIVAENYNPKKNIFYIDF